MENKKIEGKMKLIKKSSNQIALVTGSGTGLGRAIAISLANNGFKVVLVGRRENKLRKVENEIGKEKSIVLTADVLNEKSLINLREKLFEHIEGRLDLLVNNVGGVPVISSIDKMSLNQWQNVIDINLTSAFLVTKTFLPALRKSNNGKIISITSMAAHAYFKGLGAYSVSKAALESFMKILGEEEKEHGIETHIFDPGNVISEGNPYGEKDPMEIAGKVMSLIK